MGYIGDIVVSDTSGNLKARIAVTAGMGMIHLAVSGGPDAGFVKSRLEQLCNGIGELTIENENNTAFSVCEKIDGNPATGNVLALQKRHGKYSGLAMAAASALSVEGRVASFSAGHYLRG